MDKDKHKGFSTNGLENGGVTALPPSSTLTATAIGRKANDVFTVNGRFGYVIREVA